MLRSQPWIIAVLVLLPPVGGCAGLWTHKRADYQTIVGDPHRDPEKAAKENERAGKLLEKGKRDEAEQALQKALIADVGHGPAHNNLGKIHFARDEYYLAAWEFEYATKLMPDRPEPVNNLAMVYETVDRLDQAIELYSLAYELAPHDPVYMGNLARSLLTRDPQGMIAHDLLRELILHDTRPDSRPVKAGTALIPGRLSIVVLTPPRPPPVTPRMSLMDRAPAAPPKPRADRISLNARSFTMAATICWTIC